MTQKQEFKKAMMGKGFTVSNFQGSAFQGTCNLVAHHRKSQDGTHTIINSVNFVIWGGKNVKKGNLGCVTFFYHGASKEKYSKQACKTEILKKAFCPKTVQEAVNEYDKWAMETFKTIESWKVIL